MLPGPHGSDPAWVEVSAYFPLEPTLTCNSALPIRLCIRKLVEYCRSLTLQNLQIMLKGYTNYRTQASEHVNTQSWIIQSLCNLNLPIGREAERIGTEIDIGTSLWDSRLLPESVVPTFKTCNIWRTYELDILLGFQYGSSSVSKFIW